MLSILSHQPLIHNHQEPATAQQTFSSSNDPTVWRAIPILEFMQEAWENMANLTKFHEFRMAIEAGLANLRKWYRKVDDTDAYFICLGMSLCHDLS
jgi:hypothetical protein